MGKTIEDNFIVYLITCIVTGEKYVGITSCTIQERFRQHTYNANSGRNGKLYDSMRLWGNTYFYIKQICIAHSIEDMELLEKLWIAVLDTFYNGLNSTTGGRYFKMLPDVCAKLSELKKNQSQDIKDKISKTLTGYKHTIESKKIRRNEALNRPPRNGKLRGTTLIKSSNKWCAKIKIDGKTINLGHYDTELEAGKAWNEGADKYWGKGVGYRNII